MKYLISSDEREAENNLLWREVAGGRIWDQEFLTHPLHSPPMPSLLFHLTLSSSSWAVNPSHPAPPSTAGTGAQQTEPSAHRQKCLEMKGYSRNQIINLPLQPTQIPATLLPSPSICIPLFLETSNKAIMYF